MAQPFDIFRIETKGNLLWLETSATVETARTRIRALARRAPGEYVVFNRQTGEKLLINADSGGGMTESREVTQSLPFDQS